jgi:hypothetical protein
MRIIIYFNQNSFASLPFLFPHPGLKLGDGGAIVVVYLNTFTGIPGF